MSWLGGRYDRELARELGSIETGFALWRRGELDVHELSDQIHRFHNGPARRLYLDYTCSHIEIAVGAAIGRGIVAEDEATPAILEGLKGLIELARDRWDEHDDESDDDLLDKEPSD